MYSENNRRSAIRRADDDFLRRMVGGEPIGDHPPASVPPTAARDASRSHAGSSCRTEQPPANDRDSVRRELPAHCASPDCPTQLPAPALAMVYAPRQCWRNLFEPEEGLSKGTIFSELVLPLEINGNPCKIRGQEVNPRRPF